MYLFRCLGVLALVCAMAPAAFAQTTTTAPPSQEPAFAPLPPEPEGLTLTPFLGLGFAGDFENTPAAFGAALGYGLDNRVSVEGEVFFAPGGEQGVLMQFDTAVTSLSANLLYHFIAEDITPYVTGGIGVMFAFTDASDTGFADDDNDAAFAWNWGAGVKTAMNERIGLRADLRYFNASDLVPDHWRLYGGVVIRQLGR